MWAKTRHIKYKKNKVKKMPGAIVRQAFSVYERFISYFTILVTLLEPSFISRTTMFTPWNGVALSTPATL